LALHWRQWPHCLLHALAVTDPVYGAMVRHRRAYDECMDAWGETNAGRDIDDDDRVGKQRWCDVQNAEEETFYTLLTITPTTKSGAIACVRQVADCGLITTQLGAWLLLMLESPLVS
jgi:phage-related protein